MPKNLNKKKNNNKQTTKQDSNFSLTIPLLPFFISNFKICNLCIYNKCFFFCTCWHVAVSKMKKKPKNLHLEYSLFIYLFCLIFLLKSRNQKWDFWRILRKGNKKKNKYVSRSNSPKRKVKCTFLNKKRERKKKTLIINFA